MRYLAVLRGINVRGDKKVPMAELRACLEAEGFEEVATHANSGNVVFEADTTDAAKVAATTRAVVEERFGFSVPVAVLSTADFVSAVDRAPAWWADVGAGLRHDAIFLVPPAKPGDLLEAIGPIDGADDQIEARGRVVFWSVPTKAYGRSPVAKVLRTEAYEDVTLRSSTTTRKLYELAKDGGKAAGS